MASKQTSISDLDNFEGLEAVRKKPEMYMGSTTDPKGAYFHTLKEATDNCIDEAYLAGRGTKIKVVVKNKKGIQEFFVADDGGGIPVEIHKKTKLPGFEMVFVKLHAGGKFSNNVASAGTHGIGVSCTNALSSEFDAWTFRKKWHHIKFKKGVRVKKMNTSTALPKEFSSWKKGTIVKFIPDESIFKGKQILSRDTIYSWLSGLTFLCPGITIEFQYDKEKIKFKKTKGLEDLVKVLLEEHDSQKMGPIFTFTDNSVDIAFCWSNITTTVVRSYVNTVRTIEGGTHENLFYNLVSAAIRKYKPNNAEFVFEDIKVGLVAVVHARVKQPKFDSQTKEKLTSEVDFKDSVKKALDEFFKKNSALARKIIKQAGEITKAKAALKRQLSLVKQATKGGRTSLPGKLFAADCKVPAKDREIFFLEGDSAGGTAKKARFSFQEILKLRGKFNNAFKTALAKFLENETVKNMISCIGTGIGKDCDPNKLRIGKIFILTDADKDGYHIRALIIAFFSKYMRPIIDAGLLYVVEAPLYVGTYKDQKFYGDTIDEIKSQLGKINLSSVELVRMKGWAECTDVDLRRFAFDCTTRKILQVKPLDKQTMEHLEEIMGKDVEYRKQMLGI